MADREFKIKITTAAGDRLIARSEGSGNWRVWNYTKADGTAVVSSGGGSTWVKEILIGSVPIQIAAGANRFGPISGAMPTVSNNGLAVAQPLPSEGYLSNLVVWVSAQMASTTNIVFAVQTNSPNSTMVDSLLTCTLVGDTGVPYTNDLTHSVILTTSMTIGGVRYTPSTALPGSPTIGWKCEWWHQLP